MSGGETGKKKRRNLLGRMRTLLADHAYAVTLAAAAAVVIGAGIYTRDVQERTRQTTQAAAQAQEVLGTPEPEATIEPLATMQPYRMGSTAAMTGTGTVWPADGAVLRGHDEETPVLWETLGVWQVHKGVDIGIQGKEGICAAADGIVKEITYDALWGTSVKEKLLDGRTVIYRGLNDCDVVTGQRVVRGQQLGMAAETIPCEAELEAHVHLEVYDETGTMQQPRYLLPKR